MNNMYYSLAAKRFQMVWYASKRSRPSNSQLGNNLTGKISILTNRRAPLDGTVMGENPHYHYS